MHRLAGALCVVALVSVPGAASAQVIPLADCVTEGSSPGLTQALFGYRNPETATVVVPLGPDNFFTPGAMDGGQPTAFEPGEFHRVFAVEFPSNGTVTWFLAGVQAPANATLPSCDQPLTWLGSWDATATYDKNQLVSYLGSAWIARRRNTAQPPDMGTDWHLLAQKGDIGPQGIQGVRGETGEQGREGIQGPPGAPGITPAFPASPIFTVPGNGRLTIDDPNVKDDSVVIAVYVGGLRAGDGGRRGHKGGDDDERKSLVPPAITDIDEGQITIQAAPHRRIRYVVFK